MDIKQKQQMSKQNKLIDTDNIMVSVPEGGEPGEEKEDKEGQIDVNERRLGFRWWGYQGDTGVVLQSCTSEMYIMLYMLPHYI